MQFGFFLSKIFGKFSMLITIIRPVTGAWLPIHIYKYMHVFIHIHASVTMFIFPCIYKIRILDS